MQALILAAGQGRRLLPLTADRPKCLLPLGETTFIEFQVERLRQAGAGDVGIVTGFCADQVRDTCGTACHYFHNAEYDSTNSLYSFMLAEDFVRRGTLVLNSDVVFHADMLRALLDAPHANALLVDFTSELGEEEMKVVCDGELRVEQLSKDIAPWEAGGENVGIVRMDADAAQAVVDEARHAADAGHRNLWLPQGVALVLERIPFHAVAADGMAWTEVDYKHDLDRAQTEIYPLVSGV